MHHVAIPCSVKKFNDPLLQRLPCKIFLRSSHQFTICHLTNSQLVVHSGRRATNLPSVGFGNPPFSESRTPGSLQHRAQAQGDDAGWYSQNRPDEECGSWRPSPSARQTPRPAPKLRSSSSRGLIGLFGPSCRVASAQSIQQPFLDGITREYRKLELSPEAQRERRLSGPWSAAYNDVERFYL